MLQNLKGRATVLAAGAALATFFLSSCAIGSSNMDADRIRDVLSQRVAATLSSADSAVVPAASLTDFPWEQLCFQRGDNLLLKIRHQGGEVTVPLNYSDFFVDEAYVAGSLDGACLGFGDSLVVRRKYPNDVGPVEFQKITAERTP